MRTHGGHRRLPRRPVRRPVRLVAGLAVLGCLLAACGSAPSHRADADGGEHDWSYADPAAWTGECPTGHHQSPIDLTGATEEDLPDLVFDYVAAEPEVTDNGHTVLSTYAAGGTLEVDGTSYTLLQFHLHAPSEHTVDGRELAAELHLVHQSDEGEFAVVGVLVERGAANAAIEPVLSRQPGEVDPAGLLPASHRTFRYEGSLTTPPCTEGVHWMVMQEPISFSGAQIREFTALHPGSHRPVQPLGDRELVADATG